ncbi:DUF4249 family protein [Bacteroidota bacterium]
MSKLLHIGFHLLCTYSCIEPFHPEIKEMQDRLVINGSISDQPGLQFVEVSRSSPYNEPGFIPVKGCVVRVEDENGQGLTYSENPNGFAYLGGLQFYVNVKGESGDSRNFLWKLEDE